MLQRSLVLTLLCAAVSFVPCFGQTQATFQTQTQNLNSYQFPSSAPSVYSVDLNNDGIQDLIQVPTTSDPANGFQVYLGSASGKFTAGYSYTFSSNPGSNIEPVIGDFNGDGNADIVFILAGTNLVATFLGNGDGTFQTPKFQNVVGSSTPFGAAATIAADYNHDGKLDIVATTNTSTGSNTLVTINIIPGNGDGTFGFPEISYQEPSNGGSSNWLGVGDFDGDGNMDVAFESFVNCAMGTSGCQASLHVLYGSGTSTGAFTDSTPYTSTNSVMNFAAGDLNSDGTTDLFGIIGTGPQQVVALYGENDRTMPVYTTNANSAYPLQVNATVAPALGDFNGDTRMDLVAQGSNSSGSEVFAIFLATGSPGTFTEQIVNLPLSTYSESASQAPLVGAFATDAYGRPDIITLNETNNDNTNQGYATITAALNKTNGGFWGGCAFPAKGQGFSLCSPTAALMASGPLTFNASANSFGDLRKIELWIDGNKIGQQFYAWEQRAWFDMGNVNLAPGSHTAVFFAADIDNHLQGLTYNFQIVNCAAPSSPGVNVCSPTNGSTVTSPVQATAAATVTGTIQKMEVWVDGVKKYSTFGDNALTTSISLAAGSHQFGYYAVNTAGQKWLTISNVTVK